MEQSPTITIQRCQMSGNVIDPLRQHPHEREMRRRQPSAPRRRLVRTAIAVGPAPSCPALPDGVDMRHRRQPISETVTRRPADRSRLSMT